MLDAVIQVLTALGVLQAIQFAAVALVAIFLYRYFVDRG